MDADYRRGIFRQLAVVGGGAVLGVAIGLLMIGIAGGYLVHPAVKTAGTTSPASAHVIGPQPVLILSVQMVTAAIGWGYGARADRPDRQILRTVDGGRHWTDITPPAARNARFIPDFYGADHAWVLVNGEQRHNRVYWSSDGGMTWLAGSSFVVDPSYGPYGPMGRTPLQFVDPRHGFITFGFGNGDGIGVYGSNDGGGHWQLRSLTVEPAGKSTPRSLPAGCQKTGLTFSSPVTGWATANCSGGRPFFYVSKDAGRTWQAQSLPVPLGYPADLFSNCVCGSLPPAFSSAQNGIVAFRDPDFAYSTQDGGTTWMPLSLPSRTIGDVPLFLDGSTGWVVTVSVDPTTRVRSFDRLFVTKDGGQSWSPIPTDHQVVLLAFADAHNGWALLVHSDQSPPDLGVTADGGATWSVIQPVVTQEVQQERV